MSQLLVGARQVVTCRGPRRARRGIEQGDLEVLEDAAVVVENGRIAAVGPRDEVERANPNADHVTVDGVLFPGLVDAHTHGVFGGARTLDHERRALGVPYKQIAAEGGGILESVRDCRTTNEDDLRQATAERLKVLLAHGTTTVEVKSGYGLDLETELKQLRVVQVLAAGPQNLIPTFLGAHEIPAEYRSRRGDYVDLVVEEMLPAVADASLARFCDVFCEPGVFTINESRRILQSAKALGFGLRLHADELDASGGAELAAELGAASADHLAAISETGVQALAASGTVATLLPGTMTFLGKRDQAPARRLIDAGVPVALATDFNPGSSPTPSLPLMMTLGMSQMGMRAAETVIAVTVNAAASLGMADHAGQIAEGFRADMVCFGVDDWREVPYWYGANLVRQVWCAGSGCLPQEGSVCYWITGISGS